MKKDGVTQQETAAAIAKLRTETAFSRDGSFAIAGILNEDIAVGDWQNYVQLPERYPHVTPAMVQSIAAKYFNENQSTTGWFVPLPPGAPKPAAAK